LAAEHDHHVDFTPVQREHEHMAFSNHDLRASVNEGRPRIAATARPTVFNGHDVTGARATGTPYHATEHVAGGPGGRGTEFHAGDRPAGATGHGPEMHAGGPAHSAQMRTDRPPGASGNAAIHGGTGGGSARGEMHSADRPAMSHGAETHAGGPVHEPTHLAAAHNDRPPAAGGGGSMDRHASGSSMPHQFNGGGQATSHPQVHMEAPRSAPREAHMEAPRMQAPQHMEAPRPQAAPHMQNAPHPQAAPRPEAHRGGGEPPHGQGGAPRPQMRGAEQNHGRR
jgi:hypothetical protein